jgi:hypothetical protein
MKDDAILREINDSISVKQKILEDAALVYLIRQVADECIAAYRRGNRVLLAGNGGSAADAQHIAAEFVSGMIMAMIRSSAVSSRPMADKVTFLSVSAPPVIHLMSSLRCSVLSSSALLP